MSAVRNLCGILLAALLVGLPHNAAIAQNEECRQLNWLAVTNYPEQNGFFSLGQKFVPQHTRGDREFKGNGPLYTVNVMMSYTALGIYADVDMKAWEVDKENNSKYDFTTAEGSTRQWFYEPPFGWELREIRLTHSLYSARVSYTLNIPDHTSPTVDMISTGFNIKNRRDSNGHAPERWSYPDQDYHPNPLIGSIEVVGDTKGDDAGRTTSVSVSIPIDPNNMWIKLCRMKSTFHWSSAGPIPGMSCIQISEPNEPVETTWNDNYLCSTMLLGWLGAEWSSDGALQNMNCVQWHESREPTATTWGDNYLCFSYQPLSAGSWNFTYAWSSAGPVSDKLCTQIHESSEPAETTWGDNYFCYYPFLR